MSHVPKHVVDAQNKRRQRRVYFKMIQRAGFIGEKENSLSCIEPDTRAELSLDEPPDYRLGSASTLSKEHDQHVSPSSKRWLGPASKSLLSSIESSRLYDIFVRPIKRENESCFTQNDNAERPTAKKMPDFFQSERMENVETLVITNRSLSQSLFKTTISEGFGKLVYPNGQVYIGMVRRALYAFSRQNLYAYLLILLSGTRTYHMVTVKSCTMVGHHMKATGTMAIAKVEER